MKFTIACTVAGLATAAAMHSARRLSAARRELRHTRHVAEHDPLTGLLNRAGLQELWPTMAPLRPAVAVLDLDGFKPINDTHGHAIGDHVLLIVGNRLSRVARAAAVRLGGDEFALIFPSGATDDQLADQLLGVATQLAAPIPLRSGANVRVTASIGLTPGPGGLAELLADADAAMYRAKTTGCTVAVFDPARDDHTAPGTDPRPAVRVRELAHSDTVSAFELEQI